MDLALLVLAAIAVLTFGAVFGILSAPMLKNRAASQSSPKQEPWEKALEDFMRASHGANDPAVIRGMTYFIIHEKVGR